MITNGILQQMTGAGSFRRVLDGPRERLRRRHPFGVSVTDERAQATADDYRNQNPLGDKATSGLALRERADDHKEGDHNNPRDGRADQKATASSRPSLHVEA